MGKPKARVAASKKIVDQPAEERRRVDFDSYNISEKHGYPPDMTENAVETVETVLEQAELLTADWAA